MGSLVVFQERADVSPASSFIFRRLGGPPFPVIVELYGWAAAGRYLGLHELDVWILVKVRIGMEFPGSKDIKILGTGSKDESQPINCRVNGCLGRLRRWPLPYNKREDEVELVAVVQS